MFETENRRATICYDFQVPCYFFLGEYIKLYDLQLQVLAGENEKTCSITIAFGQILARKAFTFVPRNIWDLFLSFWEETNS